MNKKLIKLISILLCVILFAGCGKNELAQESISTHRDLNIGDIYFILEGTVPLSGEINDKDTRIQLFNQINEYRISSGLTAFKWDDKLAEAADVRAEEASVCWSHDRPSGEPFWTVNDTAWGENLAKGYTDAQEVLEGWQNSPTHNENLLYPDFKYLAIGQYGNYFSAEFAY